jgi:hypothetical protein
MTRTIYESQTVRQTYSAIVGFSQSYVVLVSVTRSGACMTRYDSFVRLRCGTSMSTSSIRFLDVVTYGRVLKTSCGRLVSAAWSSWTLEFYLPLPFSSAFGPPKCDVSHLVDPQSALCSSASVTRRYLVTRRHDIPLPSHLARSQRVITSTQVGLCAVCTLH